MITVSRLEAKKEGLTRYFTGKPCPAGHTCERLVSNACCVDCLHDKTASNKPPSFRRGIKNWKDRNADKVKEIVRFSTIKGKYGLSKSEWDALFESQGRACAICAKTDPIGHWSTDHCHTSGKVRGILCSNCNAGIGQLSDDVDRLKAAIKYLETHK
jgi:hypothetical protein